VRPALRVEGRGRVEQPLHPRPHPLWPAAAARTRGRALGAGEIEEMRSLRIVELERTGKRLEDRRGDARGVAALELRVVGDTDAREQRDLFPSQAETRRRPLP
jgi:hypothetical protein